MSQSSKAIPSKVSKLKYCLDKAFVSALSGLLLLSGTICGAGAQEANPQIEDKLTRKDGAAPSLTSSSADACLKDPQRTIDPLGEPRLVLKHDALMYVLDDTGMIPGKDNSAFGLYRDDTRCLSRLRYVLNGQAPELLSKQLSGYSANFVYGVRLKKEDSDRSIVLRREVALYQGVSERLTVTNFAPNETDITLALCTKADFKDMFEVRGFNSTEKPRVIDTTFGDPLRYVYAAGSGSTEISMISDPKPVTGETGFNWRFHLKPGQSITAEITILPEIAETANKNAKILNWSFEERLKRANVSFNTWKSGCGQITTDNERFNKMLDQAYLDLYLLRQPVAGGTALTAGLPWYAVPFGRDQAITGYQTALFMPGLSKEILQILAAYQGTKIDAKTEEAPGKIMHELRTGELARKNIVPFHPYYGTIDATPLWVILLQKYFYNTGDIETINKLKPNLDRAIDYLISASGDGFLKYGGESALSNQCWKDSGNSMMDSKGKLATAPIAAAEVQGYLYQAYLAAAQIYVKTGDTTRAKQLAARAEKLKKLFDESFWMPDKNYYAMALGKGDRQCDVVSSNPGHLLVSGIIPANKVTSIANKIMEPGLFSGYGIRTLSTNEIAYNPVSYHNGSIWPHDNAMTVLGLSMNGRKEDAAKVFEGLFEAGQYFDDHRLPELFCGFEKRDKNPPVSYPVSCSPQAWASGCLFQMLESCLGVEVVGVDSQLIIKKPFLPKFLNTVSITGLSLGDGKADFALHRGANGAINLRSLRTTGKVKLNMQGSGGVTIGGEGGGASITGGSINVGSGGSINIGAGGGSINFGGAQSKKTP
ncbi:MAG: amylo-alpha-1,6-glucosidase [Leptolyngbya sp.]|nr:amylo-alpha-1,6-glucosidase [Candidatus Melainabacteria bacterium]